VISFFNFYRWGERVTRNRPSSRPTPASLATFSPFSPVDWFRLLKKTLALASWRLMVIDYVAVSLALELALNSLQVEV
jgi:hypothetical protein